jgi:5-methylcytosine-specific restriction endonuclease McrA
MPTGVYLRKPLSEERLEKMRLVSPFQKGHHGFGGGVKNGFKHTEETNRKKSQSLKKFYKLHPDKLYIAGWWKGRKREPFTQEHKDKLLIALKKGTVPSGSNHSNWKGGISKDRKKWFKDWRLKTGRTKKIRDIIADSSTPEYKRMQRKKYKYLKKNAGELTVEIIQMIYEVNIKKYGTLTCYLCFGEIPFGKDHLEHKIPLSRGGTNEYNNLEIACQKCNCKKHAKTVEEFVKCKP